jgi:lactoylglutathione lyase
MAVFLHTRIRVSNLDQSIQFYCENLGFLLRGRNDKSPAGNQLAFLQLPGNEHEIELTYSPDYKLNVPEDLMHFALGVPNLVEFCEVLEKKGIEIWPGDWRDKASAGEFNMAFIDDPDGYEIELLER